MFIISYCMTIPFPTALRSSSPAHPTKWLEVIVSVSGCLVPSNSERSIEWALVVVASVSTQVLNYSTNCFHARVPSAISSAFPITQHFFDITLVPTVTETICLRAAGIARVGVVQETDIRLQHHLWMVMRLVCGCNEVFFISASVTGTPCTQNQLLVVLFVKSERIGNGGHPVAIVSREL